MASKFDWLNRIGSHRLPPYEVAMLHEIAVHCRADGRGCFAKQETLAERTGMPRPTANKIIKSLKAKGFVIDDGYHTTGTKRLAIDTTRVTTDDTCNDSLHQMSAQVTSDVTTDDTRSNVRLQQVSAHMTHNRPSSDQSSDQSSDHRHQSNGASAPDDDDLAFKSAFNHHHGRYPTPKEAAAYHGMDLPYIVDAWDNKSRRITNHVGFAKRLREGYVPPAEGEMPDSFVDDADMNWDMQGAGETDDEFRARMKPIIIEARRDIAKAERRRNRRNRRRR